MQKFSKQRELIYNAVNDNRVHPTAENIYNLLKPENPQLSLGTVYRNLQQLADKGLINRLSMANMPDRFDGNIAPHYHTVCSCCGKLEDVFVDYFKDIDKIVEDSLNCRVESHSIVFNTVCSDCLEKSNAKREAI